MREIAAAELVLEPQLASHAEAMFEVLRDPALYEHENEPPPSVEWLRRRFERLESRRSADGLERWLNWVVRLPDGSLAGYVQATIFPSGRAAIAYVFASRHWGKGLATRAVRAMMADLARHEGVAAFTATLKAANARSRRLLERCGFGPVGATFGQATDEIRMERLAFLRRDIVEADVPRLQRFLDANPEYFLDITGQPPRPDEAAREFSDRPPATMSWSRHWIFAYEDAAGDWVAMASGVADLFAPRCWHLALFLVATPLRGTGVAHRVLRDLESWIESQGAGWIRLGVVVRNTRGERFWEREGYQSARVRSQMPFDLHTDDVRVRVKPLGDATLAQHLERVPRDRPEAG